MDFPLELAENLIERGVILHSDIFPDIDHGKFFVVIGVDEDFVAGFFFINSNINRAIWNKQEQLAMQYPMRKADYDFLRYDSFFLFFRHNCFREKCHLNFNVLAFNICKFGCLALTLQDVFPQKA